MIIGWAQATTQGPEADLCIVGGGAAGLTMAHALRDSGLSILLLEAGEERATKTSQKHYEGELVDPRSHPWLHHFRVRAVGGSSRIWGGRCIPFDPIDFESRDWVAGPGWPFEIETLTPYYVAAQAAAEAGAFDYDPASVLPHTQSEFARGLDSALIETRLERFSRPTNFWTRFGADLTKADNVRILMNAPVQEIHLTADGSAIDHLEVRRPNGTTTQVRAKRYVLALGGLESVRLMMTSNRVKPDGLGGDHGQLGRFYMSHLAAAVGEIRFADPASVAFDYALDDAGIYVRRRLALTAQAQRDLQCLNVIFRTHLPDPADPSHGDPVLSAMFLVKNFVLYEYSRKFREGGVSSAGYLKHVGNVLRQPGRLARFANTWMRKRVFADRKLPSVVLGSKTGAYILEFHAEQAPNPDSRLTLSDERDAFGVPKLKADWRMTQQDIDSLLKAYALLASELERTGVGTLVYDPGIVAAKARTEGAYGGHHIGAARMSRDPRDGVVDPDCRVHGIENLFLASSAVFPTSSQANPTLTILALSLRLADHLRRELPNP
jgi:choline dehydrogenase-like flavoprotein